MRFSADTGGTFTDLVIEDDGSRLLSFKSPTTPDDPVRGILDAFEQAAGSMGLDLWTLLGRGESFVHATTRAINAILTGTTARTAFLTTAGHPDILLLREGGRQKFNLVQEFPEPYVPRSLTFEVPERIGSGGQVLRPLDEAAVIATAGRLRALDVEAVAVCLLWSIANPAHEVRVGELLDEHLPGIPCTLSHRLNPTLREYRRASSAAIDASLKPIMAGYLGSLERRLREAGFGGRLLLVTSNGGVLDAAAVAEAPIHVIRSGPAMAPVAGRHYARHEAGADTLVVADTGGTSYDVSLVRRGRIPWTRETWLGSEFEGHMTGFPSIDVRSIGAGGGSIAWIDDGGLLHVGPQSAGAVPGPVCYGRGGTEPTVTDASLTLGHIDPAFFLGGAMPLDVDTARQALEARVGRQLGLTAHEAASAVIRVVTENMVQLIEEISLNQGVDPREAVLVGGGGAAGLNAVAIARRLGCGLVIIPDVGPVLSAVGALLSDLTTDFDAIFMTTSERFHAEGANRVLAGLEERCRAFIAGPGAGSISSSVELSAQVRYPSEIWELEVPLRVDRFATATDVDQLRSDFDAAHQEVFGTSDPGSPIVVIGWRGRARCRYLEAGSVGTGAAARPGRGHDGGRPAYFAGFGLIDALVRHFDDLATGERVAGPAIIESPVTTVVVDPGALVERSPNGSLLIRPWAEAARQ